MTEFKDIIGELDEVTGERKPEVFVTFVNDHSGSMVGSEKLSMDNFNEQLVTIQRNKDVSTYVTVIDFDDRIIETGPIPAKDVKLLSEWWLGGSTALNDSIFKAITLNEKMMKASKNEDKSSLIIVITDGHENSSKEFRGPDGAEKLKKIIEEKQNTDEWTITFMGAGLDIQNYAIHTLGIDAGNTMSFDKSTAGFDKLKYSTVSGIESYYNMRSTGGGRSMKNFIAEEDDEHKEEWNDVTARGSEGNSSVGD